MVRLAMPGVPFFLKKNHISMTKHERIFLDKLSDLRDLVKRPCTEYELEKAVGILRHFLVDGQRLIDQANINHRHKFIFRAKDDSKPPFMETIEFAWLSLNPGKHVDKNINQFLRTVCLIYKGKEFTVKDVIKYVAHNYAIHTGLKGSDAPDNKKLLEFESMYKIGEINPLHHLILSIGNVTAIAVEPLEAKIISNTNSQSQ